MQPSSLPRPDDFAQLLGLKDWRVGVHRFGAECNLWAHTLWWVEVEPSFHAHWVIAGVCAGDWQPDAPVWRKAIMAQGQASEVIELEEDRVAEALNAIPLLRASMGMRLDGVGYRVHTEAVPLSAEFWFANPEVPQLVCLERALLELGERIAARSQALELVDLMKVWRQYTAGR
jgi:hypothetical protein